VKPPLPVVLMHGIGANSSTVAHPKAVLEATFPGIYVLAVDVGGNGANEAHDSWFFNINKQVDLFCAIIRHNPILRTASEINLIGFSQGGLIARGYIEKCAGHHNASRVNTFISWVSPQGGQFGVPGLGGQAGIMKELDETMTMIGDCCVYEEWAQESFSFPGYWKDPKKYKTYLAHSSFLADLNNERAKKNQTYKKAITSLKQMALSYSLVDEILQPKETGWFESYAPQGFFHFGAPTLVTLNASLFYRDDWLGIRTLDQSGRLTKFRTTCKHGDYSSACFDRYFNQFVVPLLRRSNTL